jgi:hypothetical protein
MLFIVTAVWKKKLFVNILENMLCHYHKIIKNTEIHKLLFRMVSGLEDINILRYPRIFKL